MARKRQTLKIKEYLKKQIITCRKVLIANNKQLICLYKKTVDSDSVDFLLARTQNSYCTN